MAADNELAGATDWKKSAGVLSDTITHLTQAMDHLTKEIDRLTE